MLVLRTVVRLHHRAKAKSSGLHDDPISMIKLYLYIFRGHHLHSSSTKFPFETSWTSGQCHWKLKFNSETRLLYGQSLTEFFLESKRERWWLALANFCNVIQSTFVYYSLYSLDRHIRHQQVSVIDTWSHRIGICKNLTLQNDHHLLPLSIHYHRNIRSLIWPRRYHRYFCNNRRHRHILQHLKC